MKIEEGDEHSAATEGDTTLSLTSGHINVWMTDIHPIVRQHKHNTLSWLSFYVECLMEIALEGKTRPVQSDILALDLGGWRCQKFLGRGHCREISNVQMFPLVRPLLVFK